MKKKCVWDWVILSLQREGSEAEWVKILNFHLKGFLILRNLFLFGFRYVLWHKFAKYSFKNSVGKNCWYFPSKRINQFYFSGILESQFSPFQVTFKQWWPTIHSSSNHRKPQLPTGKLLPTTCCFCFLLPATTDNVLKRQFVLQWKFYVYLKQHSAAGIGNISISLKRTDSINSVHNMWSQAIPHNSHLTSISILMSWGAVHYLPMSLSANCLPWFNSPWLTKNLSLLLQI